MVHFFCARSRTRRQSLLNRLQRESKLPLLFAADFERGVRLRLIGSDEFPARDGVWC